jgi:hypothetical protein
MRNLPSDFDTGPMAGAGPREIAAMLPEDIVDASDMLRRAAHLGLHAERSNGGYASSDIAPALSTIPWDDQVAEMSWELREAITGKFDLSQVNPQSPR